MRWLILVVLPLLMQCQSFVPEKPLRFNQIQILGSHNSYKKAIDPEVMSMLSQSNPDVAMSLDYSHLPLDEQLDHGLRQLELDVFHDPEGGRYTEPFGLTVATNPAPFNVEPMRRPGFKVFHVQDIDFRSHCPTFKGCLEIIKSWSDRHPDHIPLVITINAKDDVIDNPEFVTPLPFDKQAWADLDKEIRQVLGDRLYAPDDLRGEYSTLREAVLAGWPTLNELRGKFMFVLDDSEQKIQSYIDGHPSLEGRAMFVDAPEESPEASFRIVNDPRNRLAYIQALVRQGFIVRTRADADTLEARQGDTARLDAALASGAQIISTDYYVIDNRLETEYKAELPGDVVARCNPVLIHGSCKVSE